MSCVIVSHFPVVNLAIDGSFADDSPKQNGPEQVADFQTDTVYDAQPAKSYASSRGDFAQSFDKVVRASRCFFVCYK